MYRYSEHKMLETENKILDKQEENKWNEVSYLFIRY